MGNSCFLWKKGKTLEDNLERKKELCSGRVATHIRKVFAEREKKGLWNEIPRYRICILCFTVLAVTAHDFSVNTPETTGA